MARCSSGSKSIKFTKTISCRVPLVAPLAVQARQAPGAFHEPTPTRTSGSSIYPAVHNMLLAARALGLGATLTMLYVQFETEVEAALGLPPGVHSYAFLPIGYPMGRFGRVRRIPLTDVVYEVRWGEPPCDL
jgi:nitroreductase